MNRRRQQIEPDPVSEKLVVSKRGFNEFHNIAKLKNELCLKNQAELIVHKKFSKKHTDDLKEELDKKEAEINKLIEENKLLSIKNGSYKSSNVEDNLSIFNEETNKKMLDSFVDELEKQYQIEYDRLKNKK